MSKTSFRARALDASTPLSIHMSEELPELQEYSASNRALPEMPTGMEKEEEAELHLQEAIRKGLTIPTPQVASTADVKSYDEMYHGECRLPRQLIRSKIFSDEENLPDYDADSEDEQWLRTQSLPNLTLIKFEEIMDRLEKSYGQTVFKFEDAKLLLADDDESVAVFAYWLERRLKHERPIHPRVKIEQRGTKGNDPYMIFRKHPGKVRTRKGRKTNEINYQKMLYLRKDFEQLKTILEFVEERELTKKNLLQCTAEIYEKRYEVGDFDGSILADIQSAKPARPPLVSLAQNRPGIHKKSLEKLNRKEDKALRKERKQSTKEILNQKIILKIGGLKQTRHIPRPRGRGRKGSPLGTSSGSSDENGQLFAQFQWPDDFSTDQESPEKDEFPFRRNKHSAYLAPTPGGFGNAPWCSQAEGGSADDKYRFSFTSIRNPRPRCVGFVRRRIGRGGRVILDRYDNTQDLWSSLDYTVFQSADDSNNKSDFLHFHPKSPQADSEPQIQDYDSDSEVADSPEPIREDNDLFPAEAASICINIELGNFGGKIGLKKNSTSDEPPFESEFNISDYFSPNSLSDLNENIHLDLNNGW